VTRQVMPKVTLMAKAAEFPSGVCSQLTNSKDEIKVRDPPAAAGSGRLPIGTSSGPPLGGRFQKRKLPTASASSLRHRK